MLLEEVVVVVGIGLRLPELLLPHHVHVMGTGLADGHGSVPGRGWRRGGGGDGDDKLEAFGERDGRGRASRSAPLLDARGIRFGDGEANTF